MNTTMPPLTSDEMALVANIALWHHPSMVQAMQAYHWCKARLALAQYVAERALKEDRQPELVGVGKEGTK